MPEGKKTFKYVLTQQGCARPILNAKGINYDYSQVASVSVPIQSAVLSTSSLSYLEILGVRDTVIGLNGLYTSSPCANRRINESKIIDVSNKDYINDIDRSDSCKGISPNVNFRTASNFDDSSCTGANTTTIYVGDIYEGKLIQHLEWINFYSLFYNKETAVGKYIVTTESALACLQATVQSHVATRLQARILPAQKNVLWATPSYKSNDNTWEQIGTCPNFYCDAIRQGGGIPINDLPEIIAFAKQIEYANGKTITNISNQTITLEGPHTLEVGDQVMQFFDAFGAPSTLYYVKSVPSTTSLELMSKSKGLVKVTCSDFTGSCKLNKALTSANLLFAVASIDVVIAEPLTNYYTNFLSTVATCQDFWRNLPRDWSATRTQSVYDYGKAVSPNNGLDWFATRYALADVLVEDMANIIYPELKIKGNMTMKWFQNVYTEGSCSAAAPTPAAIVKVQKALALQCPNSAVTFSSPRHTYCKTSSAPITTNSDSGSAKKPLETYAVALIVVAVILGFFIIVGLIVMYRSHQTIKNLYQRLQVQDAKVDPNSLSAPLTTSDPTRDNI